MDENAQGRGGVGEQRAGSQGVRLWTTCCLHGLPACMSWPAALWLLPSDLALPGTALALLLPSPAATPLTTAHWSSPCIWHHWPYLPFPVSLLEMSLSCPPPGFFFGLCTCVGPSVYLISTYSFPSYLRCFLLQEALPDHLPSSTPSGNLLLPQFP